MRRGLSGRERLALAAAALALLAALAGRHALRPSRGARSAARDAARSAALAWTEGTPPGRFVVVARADGAAPRRLTDPALDARDPRLSADGRRLACLAGSERAPELLFIDVATGAVERAPFRPGETAGAALSPDGRRLVVAQRTPRGFDLFQARSGSNAVDRLTDDDLDESDPALSPDGRFLAWLAGPPAERAIVAARADGANATTLPLDPGPYTGLSFSPDGRRLAFLDAGALVVASVDGAERRVAHPGPVAGSPAWSPEGAHLLVALRERERAGLVRIPLDGGSPLRLAESIHPGAVAHAAGVAQASPHAVALETEPPEAEVEPGGALDLAGIQVFELHDTGLRLAVASPVWSVAGGGGFLEPGRYLAPAEPGAAVLRAARAEDPDGPSADLAVTVVAAGAPLALRLTPNFAEAEAGRPFDLSAVVARLELSDGSVRGVRPEWRAKRASGTLADARYVPAAGEEVAVLTAVSREGGERTADLTLTVSGPAAGGPAADSGAEASFAAPLSAAAAPEALLLDRSEIRLSAASMFNLGGIGARVRYAGGAERRVTPVWRLAAGAGSVDGAILRTAGTGEGATLVARHEEGGVAVEAALAVLVDAAAPAPETGTLVVRSVPAGATVHLDGKPCPNLTDFTLREVKPGRRKLRFELGTRTLDAECEIVAGQAVEVTARLEGLSFDRKATVKPLASSSGSSAGGPVQGTAQPPAGRLAVKSLPPGARVSVDGVERVSTDSVIDGVTAGLRRLLFAARDGRTLGAVVAVTAGTTLAVTADFDQGTVTTGDAGPADPGSRGLPPRFAFAAAALGDTLFAFDGRGERGDALSATFASEPGGGWALLPPSGMGPRFGHAACVHRGRVVIAGGASGALVLSDVWATADGRLFERLTAAAEFGGRYGHALVSFGGRLLLLGGTRRDGPTLTHQPAAEIWESGDGARWTRITDRAPFGGGRVFAAAAGGRLLVAPESGDRLFATDDGRDFTAGTPPGWTMRTVLAMSPFGSGAAIVVGRPGEPMTLLALDGRLFATTLAPALPMTPRRDFALVERRGKLVLFGGAPSAGGGALGDAWESPDGSRWSELR